MAAESPLTGVGPQLSHPEIVIEKLTPAAAAVPMVPARSGASVIDAAPSRPSPMPSDSMQFVMPSRGAGRRAGRGAIDDLARRRGRGAGRRSRRRAAHVALGGAPPSPLSQLATDELVRPDDGDEVRSRSRPSGALIIRVADRVLTRLDGVHVTGGDLAYEPAMRRSRGHQTEERFDYGGTQLHTVTRHAAT